jgi:hypothetical protein
VCQNQEFHALSSRFLPKVYIKENDCETCLSGKVAITFLRLSLTPTVAKAACHSIWLTEKAYPDSVPYV